MSNVVEKVKKQVISLGFSSYFTWDYLLKQEAVVIKPPESQNLSQLQLEIPNFKDVRANFFPYLGQKWQKNPYNVQ